MVYDDLLTFLENSVTATKFQTYKEIIPFLNQINPAVLEYSLEQFISFNDSNTTTDNIEQFDLYILNNAIDIVESFGVYISDDQPIADLSLLFSRMAIALYRIDRYEDLLGIKFILSTEHDPRETIADILSLMDQRLVTEEMMTVISDVSPSLIKNIGLLLADLDYQFDESPNEKAQADVERVKNAMVFYGVEKAVRYFKNGGSVGDPIEVVLDTFFSEGINRTPEEWAKLIMFSGYIANLPDDVIKSILSEKTSYYITDVDFLLKVTRALTKIPLLGATNE